MTATLNHVGVMEYLREHGYTPDEGGRDWFDRTDSLTGGHAIRVALDDGRIVVHGFDGHMVNLWTATFTYETPAAMVFAALTAAEGQVFNPWEQSAHPEAFGADG